MQVVELKPIRKVPVRGWMVKYKRKSRRGITNVRDYYPTLSVAQKIWWRYWDNMKGNK